MSFQLRRGSGKSTLLNILGGLDALRLCETALLKASVVELSLISSFDQIKQLTKAVLERALKAELSHHLGYEKPSPAGKNSGNAGNGKSKKTLKGDFGTLPM